MNTAAASGDPKIAVLPPSLLEKGIASGKYRYEEGELEKLCSRCKDGLNNWCKACYLAWRYPNGRTGKNET